MSVCACVSCVCRYLQDKDFFGEIHKNFLAKRLLNNRSKSDDLEKSMIGHLKIECGAQFTQPLEGMLNDIHGGNPRGMAFKDYLDSRGLTVPIPGFEVRVLTTGFWPLYPLMRINVPAEMQACMTAYTDHYMSHTNHRTLNWVHRLGFATVRATYKKWYDLQATTLQAMVLLQFNSGKASYVTLCSLRCWGRFPRMYRGCGRWPQQRQIACVAPGAEGLKCVVRPTRLIVQVRVRGAGGGFDD